MRVILRMETPIGGFPKKQRMRLGPPLHKRKRGQALLEFAITLLILLLLVVGALELGRVIFSGIVITNAAREGAYYLSYDPKVPADYVTVVNNESRNSGVFTPLEVSSSGCCMVGDPVTVTVKTRIDGLYIIGLLGNGSDNSILISRSVEMMVVR